MAFHFHWPQPWDAHYLEQLRTQLTEQMNKGGPQHPALVDPLIMKDLQFGSKPPVFKLEKIEELTGEKAVLHFYVAFSGDASVTIQTRVQVIIICTFTIYIFIRLTR